MIKTLKLRNWRNYDDITVDFGSGTTFIVASNGIGKTSLVEAARWALYGVKGRGTGPIRNGRAEAFAGVVLELPGGRVLEVQRNLRMKGGVNQLSVNMTLDGNVTPPEELEPLLKTAYGAESWFLAGVTMPAVDPIDDKPSALRLREHLGQYYGIDSLSDALRQLKVRQKEADARIRLIKQANAVSAKAVDGLLAAREAAEKRVEATRAEHEALRGRFDKIRERDASLAARESWRTSQSQWTEMVAAMAAEVGDLLGRDIDVSTFEVALSSGVDEVSTRIEELRVQMAVTEASIQRLRVNDQRLSDAHDDCPVCRRPLDATTANDAHEANDQEVVAESSKLESLRVDVKDLLHLRSSLTEVRQRWQALPRPGPVPAELPLQDEVLGLGEVRALVDQALEAQVAAQAAAVVATKDFEDASEANHAMRELKALFRLSAKLTVALEATDRTLNEMLETNVRPLAAEVNQRWGALFPGRGALNTSADGEVTRAVNGVPLPFESFSTGEGMGASIVLRLLIAQMATMADFCWFDEPLEHLDPDTRRNVANLLTRVTSGGHPLRQVVVTTYEEPLARHLKARDEEWVTLLDVRPGSEIRTPPAWAT